MITIIFLILIFIFLELLLYKFFNLVFYKKLLLKKLLGNKKNNKLNNLNKIYEARMLTKQKNLHSKINLIYKLELRLNSAYVTMNVFKFIIIFMASCLIIFSLTFIVTDSLIYSVVSIFSIPLSTHFYLNYLEKRRINLFSEQLLELVNSLSSSLKSGYSMIQALTKIQEESPFPMSTELSVMLQDINIGKSYDEAFDKLIERNPIEELQILLTAILIARETGANIGYILDTVSNTLSQRKKLKGEVRSLTAQGRLSGIVLVLMPFAISLFIYIVNPDYISLLFTNSFGRLLLILGVVGQLIGAIIIKKIIKIDW